LAIKFFNDHALDIVSNDDIKAIAPKAVEALHTLNNKSGAGNDFLGWVDLPTNYDKEEFARIKNAADYIKKNADVLVVIGIGGSYLGARAVIEALTSPNYNALKKDTPDIYFIGNSISPSALNEVVSICEGKDICVNVISKSGTTTEPAIAFRVFRDLVNSKYSKEEAAKRIFATTDKSKGTLKCLADEEGYETFVVPDDVGGRYSVLTAVGLLPIAVAGIDIDALMAGAQKAQNELCSENIDENDVLKYAAVRNVFYNKGTKLECFVSYEPCMAMFNEWLKQLFAESEGKDGKGLFPVSCIFSTDLHSLGQYVAGMGFSNVGLGIVHSMAHPLGALYDTPHGVANAIILPTVMEYNAPATGEKYRNIAKAMGVDGVDGMTIDEARKAAVNAVKKLSKDVGIPENLKDIVKPEDVDFLAQSAYDDACRPGNPRETSVEEIKELYLSLM
jgi:glucose-6-phosphate isomerase